MWPGTTDAGTLARQPSWQSTGTAGEILGTTEAPPLLHTLNCSGQVGRTDETCSVTTWCARHQQQQQQQHHHQQQQQQQLQPHLRVTQRSASRAANRRYCALAQPTMRYDARCYFNVRSKADMSQLNLSHGNDN